MSEAPSPPPAESEEDVRFREIYLNRIEHVLGCLSSHVAEPHVQTLRIGDLRDLSRALDVAESLLARLIHADPLPAGK